MRRTLTPALLVSILASCQTAGSEEGTTAGEPEGSAVAAQAQVPTAASLADPSHVVPPSNGADPDCGQLCKLSGACVADQGRCIPTAAEHCKGSKHCTENGLCALIANACQVPAESPEDCNREHGTKKHNPCVDWGRCTAEGGTCVVASDADCQKFRECKRYGYCRAKAGKCVK
jgi:hypothetical protein